MTLRIGLMGTPGSGKSALAHTLQTAIEREDLNPDCVDCLTPVAVVDDYVPEIEGDTDLSLGFNANYIGNLHVALGRAKREIAAVNRNKTVITCGTLVETSVYVAMESVAMLNFDDEAEAQDTMRRTEATMRVLSCFYVDLFRYDHVFYLPPLIADPDSANNQIQEMDKNLQTAFRAFNLQHVEPLVVEGGDALEVTTQRATLALKKLFTKEQDESENERPRVESPVAE